MHQERTLDPDAARFLMDFGIALAFPPHGLPTDSERSEYLARERARLADIPGTTLLDVAARAVRTQEHELAPGVTARSYLPDAAGTQRPILVYLHGGGFVTGSINLNDTACRLLAARADLVVISVEYRLAPEHPYPAALDDAMVALAWASDVAPGTLGSDPSRIAIGGGSAGAGIAAAAALRARDTGGPPLALQVLIYPVLDARMAMPSYDADVNGRDYFVSAEQMAFYWDQYRGSASDADPYLSPASAADLGALPPAIVITAEFDLLRDEGIDYHERLLAAGVRSERVHYAGQIHGFMTLLESIGEAVVAIDDLAVRLRAELGTVR